LVLSKGFEHCLGLLLEFEGGIFGALRSVCDLSGDLLVANK
jgi:hypothetical protein